MADQEREGKFLFPPLFQSPKREEYLASNEKPIR